MKTQAPSRRARALRAGAARLAGVVAVLWGAATLAFLALALIPGDPVTILLGPFTTASQEIRDQIAADHDLDKPLYQRYLIYLGNLVTGDMGESYQLQKPVFDALAEALGPTVELALAAVVIAVGIAVVSAVLTAGREGRLHRLATAWELIAVSLPSHWLGILLLTAFSFQLKIFPVVGGSGAAALVLPALTLALPIAGVLAQVLREGLEAALAQPFAVTARARGLSRREVRLRHALRHAAVPLATLSGWLAGTLLGGAVIVETVFGRPGFGALALQSAMNKDMPVLIGIVLVSALVFVVLSALIDAFHLLVDPRLRT
ncbi:ABC transporter permease [Actinocorallia sp. A-T 12471]|uniref:ABC transporter permease n=1 Tax=Actinocorallia sp. A-T 12471 TaxID=3089813 RepID=UPI0029D0D89B|nr:ABC transporter permease [Actinocorallia sp. A-T 12471]MDX6741090.1 ABC transporter permease [Actinocorallia sp. A-T 12471]